MSKERKERVNQMTLEQVVSKARETALEHDGHAPTLIVEGAQGLVVAQFAQMEDSHEGRARQMAMAGFELAQGGQLGAPRQIFFISEAWMSLARAEQSLARRPSEDPERKEVLVVSNLSMRERKTEVALFEMVRNTEGCLIDLKAHETAATGEARVESPLLSAFVQGFAMGITRPHD